METKLFNTERVKKFFDILERLNGGYSINESEQIYKGYDENNPDIVYSQRHVFVNRTINKWLKGKYLIVYRLSQLGVQYKQYVYISQLNYNNNMSSTGYIGCYLIDFANPYDSFLKKENFKHNDIISLEGEWCSNSKQHDIIFNMLRMDDVPEKEYTFKAYDFNKYPKKVKRGVDPKEMIKTTISFNAKTEHEAFQKKKEYEERNSQMVVTSDIVKIIKKQ